MIRGDTRSEDFSSDELLSTKRPGLRIWGLGLLVLGIRVAKGGHKGPLGVYYSPQFVP